MPSDTSLNLVNQILVMTGDYQTKLTTVVGSPANIAERYIYGINYTLRDLVNEISFEELRSDFNAAGNGVDSLWVQSGVNARAASIEAVTGNRLRLEEVTRGRMAELRANNLLNNGSPSEFFTREVSSTGELAVDIYPTPANGAVINVIASITPTPLTVSDNSTTEITDNELLVLGGIAHADAFVGMERGYMQLYQKMKKSRWVDRNKNVNIRIQTEDYH